MSKHLLIQYGDVTLFSAPVEQISFSESDAGAVEVKGGPARRGGGGGSVLDMVKRAKESQKPVSSTEVVSNE